MWYKNICALHSVTIKQAVRATWLRDWVCYAGSLKTAYSRHSPSDIWTSHTLAWC